MKTQTGRGRLRSKRTEEKGLTREDTLGLQIDQRWWHRGGFKLIGGNWKKKCRGKVAQWIERLQSGRGEPKSCPAPTVMILPRPNTAGQLRRVCRPCVSVMALPREHVRCMITTFRTRFTTFQSSLSNS